MEMKDILFRPRIKNRFSQSYIAKEIDVSQVAYCKWENGVTTPNFKNICRLAVFYNMDVNEFTLDIEGVGFQNPELSRIVELTTAQKENLLYLFSEISLPDILLNIQKFLEIINNS